MSWEVRKRVEDWNKATNSTTRILVLPTRQEAEHYARERNKQLDRLGKRPVKVTRDEPYKEEYFVQKSTRRV